MEPTMQCFSKLIDLFSKSLLVSNVGFWFILIGLEKALELEFQCPCSPNWNKALSSLFFIVPTIMAFILMFIFQGRIRKEFSLKLTTEECECVEFILKLINERCSCDEMTLKLIDQRCSCDKSQFTLNTQEGKRDEFILKLITERCSCDESNLKLIIQGCSCDESTLKLITQRCSCDESPLTLITQICRCGKSKFTQVGKRKEWLKKIASSFVAAIVWLILLFFDGQYVTCAMTDWEGRFVLVDKAAPQKWCEPISEGNFTTQELMLRSQEWNATSQVIGMSFLFVICMGLTGYLIRECWQEKKKPRFRVAPGIPPETTYTTHHTHSIEMQALGTS
ncbi:uncharacterized protein [Takifugu rubripes]|uniref:uncharacterized protein n=1 Tax=Takifugu rubripes TaxID=31033 RepID=UPI001145AF7A|nr:uncharacterized protein LOC115252180 [Takifugu rubripes]